MITLKSWIRKYWDEVLMYFFSLAACMMANQWEAFKASSVIKIDLSPGRVAFAVCIAALATASQELIIKDDAGVKRAGKKKNLPKRIIFAILFGLGSPQAVDVMIGILTTALSSIKIGG